MVGTRLSFYLFCTILICFLSDSVVLSDPGNEPDQHTPTLETTYDNHNKEEPEEDYPFDSVYYSYKIESKKLLKDTKLDPPIMYKTPIGYSIVLEPIVHFCKVVNKSVFAKFSVTKSEDKVYINIDEDLTDELTNDSTIVYKLKAINDGNSKIVGGETTILIRIVQILPVPDTVLRFEEPSYSIKLSCGRKGKVFKFNALKKALNSIEQATDLEFEKQPKSTEHFTQKEYPFIGNYSLEYVPELLLTKLRINKDGDLEIIGYIEEGFYNFDVVASDFGPESSTILTDTSKVNMFVDNIAVCNSKESNFIKAFSKQYITEETTLQTAIPATGSNPNCIFAISHQYPLGVGTEFFAIDPKTGAVHLVNPIDREAYWFEDMEEPSVYLKLKIHCSSPAETAAVLPLHLHDLDNIAYDPTSTLVQLVILDINDNPPVFADKHMTIGYPVSDVADTIMPNYLVQVKATDKDVGKYGKIQYSLRGDDADDFVVNPDSGTIYCTRPMDNSNASKTFEVVAKDDDGKSDGSVSVMTVTVKFLTYSDIIRVNVDFSMTEDHTAIESQLSEISGVRVLSLTDNVINTFADGQWRTERKLTVYGVNNSDDSLVSGSDLEKKLGDNAKILGIMKYLTKSAEDGTNTAMSVVYAGLFCLMLSMIAMGLLYFGYVKNGRYLSCISSTSTTPLKDDMENMSQSNWITTFNRSNLSSSRVRSPGNVDSPRVKSLDHTIVAVENGQYEAIPPKAGNVSIENKNSSIIKLDSKLSSFEDDLINLEKMEETFSPTDDKSFSY